MDYNRHLRTAVDAARAAGEVLLREFNRPGGPRGTVGHCPADEEAEAIIRQMLGREFPEFGVIGEELGSSDRPAGDKHRHIWVIDPNDGTSAFQKGWRGAAVSIALLRKGVPVLGVVFAYAARAGQGDLFAWAEKQAFSRNGTEIDPPKNEAIEESTVIVSQAADSRPAENAQLCAPARFRAEPSIAYRLALVAAGDGIAAVSLNGPTVWDVAAGHALLRAAGGDLYRMGGQPVRYSEDGTGTCGNCVGGFKAFAVELSKRDWTPALYAKGSPNRDHFRLLQPDRKRIVSDSGLLSRAQGCMIGQLAGDNLGGYVEFQPASAISKTYPNGIRRLMDGGHWNILAGQPTDDSELALMLARSIVAEGRYDREAVARAYAYWMESGPFDCGGTTGNALSAALTAVRQGGSAAEAATKAALKTRDTPSNGALMRVSPLAVFGHSMPEDELAALARHDAELTHANPICRDANAVFCIAVAAAIRGQRDRQAVYNHALAWAKANTIGPEVVQAVAAAKSNPPREFQHQMGWVLIALQNAFYRLLHAGSPEKGIVATVACGGDTDTNAAIAGALLGAAWGADAFPQQWVDRLLTCRPMESTVGCRRQRPQAFWPVDCLILAERIAGSFGQ